MPLMIELVAFEKITLQKCDSVLVKIYFFLIFLIYVLIFVGIYDAELKFYRIGRSSGI